MPITFKAQVWAYKTDREGEATLTVKIPKSERDEGAEVGKKTERTLIMTVFELDEVGESAEAD